MFADDFSSATLAPERIVTFTNAESQLLRYFARHPGQTLSRDQILDGISEPGSDRRDRTVDFLINRIRRKLEDDPKNPRFIATRYGGGYIWIAEKAKPAPPLADNVFAVVGDIRGLSTLGDQRPLAMTFARALGDALQDHAADGHLVQVDPDFEGQIGQSGGPSIQVGLVFFHDRSGSECVLTCRSGISGRVYLARRLPLEALGRTPRGSDRQLSELAMQILSERWRNDVDHQLVHAPLPVAMQEATLQRSDSRSSLREMEPKLRALRAEHPDDPQVKLIYATHLHSSYVINGTEIAMSDPGRRQQDLAEIESLVLDALDYSQSQPHLAVMAAKLLYFVDRGYKSLALELAEDAHRSNTSIASSLAIVGQLHGFLGDTERGTGYLRQALDLSERNTNFERYVLIMLCQALIAAGDRQELAPYRERIYGHHPLLRVFLEPIFTDPDHPSMRAKGAMLVMSKARTKALLGNLHFIWSRLCEVPLHRANAMRAPVSLAIRRHGRSILPDELLQDIPELFD